jgi:hypothetical protein
VGVTTVAEMSEPEILLSSFVILGAVFSSISEKSFSFQFGEAGKSGAVGSFSNLKIDFAS